MKIAIIGTAGRDKSMPMTLALWQWMINDLAGRINHTDHLISGGAAWADHLAVSAFLNGFCKELTLHMPAPFDGRFIGPSNSAASAANYYHDRFSQAIGIDTLEEISLAAAGDNCHGTFESERAGYSGMFARNNKVASGCDRMLAYTFGTGDTPADGGTRDTWDKCRGERVHIPLPRNL